MSGWYRRRRGFCVCVYIYVGGWMGAMCIYVGGWMTSRASVRVGGEGRPNRAVWSNGPCRVSCTGRHGCLYRASEGRQASACLPARGRSTNPFDQSVSPPPPFGRFVLVVETGKAVIGAGEAPTALLAWIMGMADDPNPWSWLSRSIAPSIRRSGFGGGGWTRPLSIGLRRGGWTCLLFWPRPQIQTTMPPLSPACCVRACVPAPRVYTL